MPLAGRILPAAPSADTIATTVWATPEGTPSVGTHGYASWLMRQWITNWHEVDDVGGGCEIFYRDDGTTPLFTFQIRDGNGNPVTIVPGSPTSRAAAT